MPRPIDKITIQGFKSIRSLDQFELKPINILIGANGSGKSNFISFFRFLREMVEGRLEATVNKAGGADTLLYLGPKVTATIVADLRFGDCGYAFSLEPTADNHLIFAEERVKCYGDMLFSKDRPVGRGHRESKLKEKSGVGLDRLYPDFIYRNISSWIVYHFHDTSETALMRRTGSVRDNERLREDGSNLAAFLYRLRDEQRNAYRMIVDTVRLVAPFFDEFLLRPKKSAEDEWIGLEWRQKGSDYPFHASQLSDGTLRFIALTTALLQPEPPSTILLDEPELGLHPQGLDVLANLILQAKDRTQVIVSTQSAPLLNAFEPDQIIIVERKEGESRFQRLDATQLDAWLNSDYTLSDLWQKNVYGGVPTNG